MLPCQFSSQRSERQQNAAVEVFKTNVNEPSEAGLVLKMLRLYLPEARINFDLQDCDRVLRVEGKDLDAAAIARWVRNAGFDCRELEG